MVFSCSLLHEATRITGGTRYAFLPFFFDEAHETLRRKSLRLLEPPDLEADPAVRRP